jgi:hypothetical protein
MTKDAIGEAIKEANEFVQRAKLVLKEHDEPTNGHLWGDKNTAALRRQSMELTRALSKMRGYV